MRVSGDTQNNFIKPYLRLRWSEVNFCFVQPVYLASSRSLAFCPKGILDPAKFLAFKHIPRGHNRVEAVPYLNNLKALISVVEEKFGKPAGALVCQGAAVLLQGESPSSLPPRQLDELQRIKEAHGGKLVYLKNERLYVLTGPREKPTPSVAINELDSIESLLVVLKDDDIRRLREFAHSAVHFPIIADGRLWLWGQVEYNPERLHLSYHSYHGYLQVDHQQLPEALELLFGLAKERAENGKTTSFKFLISKTFIPSAFELSAQHYLRVMNHDFDGHYAAPNPSLPIIAFYHPNKEGVLEILEQLSQVPGWQKIERERKFKNRREGTSAYTNKAGIEFRTLCYNNSPGCVEDLLEYARGNGKDWRSLVNGARTITPQKIMI